MRSLLCAAGAAGVLLVASAATAVAAPAADPEPFTIKDQRITESSGLAASRAHPGIYWTHNDSDDGPYVYAVDYRTGRTVATVTMRGVGDPRDVEAVSVGPDGDLYVGDIGDNLDGSWDHVWIYRFPEPKELRDRTVTATQYVVKYADGPRNAEAMMVHPKTGRVYVVSKKEDGGAALYAGPERLTTSGPNVFQRVSKIEMWVTDGAFSPDGTRLMLRSYFGGRMFRWQDGRPKDDIGSIGVPIQGQGESVTFTPDGRTLMFGSEGAASRVEPVGLSGRQLPESVSAGSSATPGGGDGNGSDGTGDSSGPSDSSEEKSNPAVTGIIVIGVAIAAFLALRRRGRR
ncbi:hypothetical protein [Streptomyces purpurogeneiscleroticus]|uniref:hypothetical protein n=1 Tax=Streptomyces purpurogeneiscleroticus TaxID=68259 RepID=UPI001CBB9FF6|nr:hypothetical protein [Streptomyces purpurogeneiscleroticus]MBZ4017136.1 hypothetical protein [Streptomyces purpurogeneiscleroticus]